MAVAAPPRAQQHLQSLARGGALSLVGAVVSAVTNFALTVVIAHGAGRHRAGEFFALTSVFLLCETLCRLGADVGLIYFLARWRALGRFAVMRPALRIAFTPTIAFAAVVGVAMFLGAPHLSVWTGSAHSGTSLLRVLAFVLPFAVAYDLLISVTRGWSRMRPTVLIDKIVRPTTQLVFVAAALWVGSLAWLGAAWSLPYLIGVAAAFRVVRRLPWPGRGKAAAGDVAVVAAAAPADGVAPMIRDAPTAGAGPDAGAPTVAREFWSFTGPRAVAAVAALLLQRMDIVLIAAIRGPVDAAVYTGATRFLVVGQFVNQALVAPAQPRLSALLAAGDLRAAREVYETTTGWLILVVWPMYLGTAVLAPIYLSAFGSHYQSGRPVVIALCLIMLVASSVGFVDVLLIMVGRTWVNLITTSAALALDAVLDIVLIPRIGILGAAIGWAGAIAAANLVPLFLVRRILGMHPFSRSTILSMVLAAGCFGALPLAAELLTHGALLGAGVGMVLGAGLYAAALWHWRARLQVSLAVTAVVRGRSGRHRRPASVLK